MAEPDRNSPWPWVAAVLGILVLVLAVALITRPAYIAPPREQSNTTVVQPPPPQATATQPPTMSAPPQPSVQQPETSTRQPAAATPPPAAQTRTQVAVEMGEWFVRLTPATVSPGKVTFGIHNVGAVTHGFAIRGQGVNKRSATLKAGGKASVIANLQAGDYTVYCFVDDHRARGMQATFQVRTPASSTP